MFLNNVSHFSLSRTHGRTVGRTNGRTDGRSTSQTDARSDGRTNGRTDGQSDEWADGRTDGRTDGRSDGWTVGRSDGRSDAQTDGRTVWNLSNFRLTGVELKYFWTYGWGPSAICTLKSLARSIASCRGVSTGKVHAEHLQLLCSSIRRSRARAVFRRDLGYTPAADSCILGAASILASVGEDC